MKCSLSIIITFLLLQSLVFSQQARTLIFDDAMQIAREKSPDFRQARLNMERQQELLNAQEASLKSKFNLILEPFYSFHWYYYILLLQLVLLIYPGKQHKSIAQLFVLIIIPAYDNANKHFPNQVQLPLMPTWYDYK